MGDHCKHIDDASFEAEVTKAPGLVIVDFWAEWCGPCRQIGPVLEELAEQMADKVKIVKMNVDESPATPGSFGIRSIPTLIMFKDGKLVEAKVGALPRQAIINWINEKAA